MTRGRSSGGISISLRSARMVSEPTMLEIRVTAPKMAGTPSASRNPAARHGRSVKPWTANSCSVSPGWSTNESMARVSSIP
jgi:hypothetical protein